ncbi:ribosome maturation factor RimP [Isoptericola sp. b441]|uniref:Ribosome maturation factor RimP n=1 Tax=Actinotalea lenta TaxID=3064654 RepID=A0ABT9D8X5_9CELL|nr:MULTISPECIES: ribosome maturation factor RimP [unclassified Isoptericola]MDO8107358.1 ribosome maturation factor RimP [Isoptericola sp. b441]MDO8120979.1 ribosome maturation factor RimP [Isoptericola sp. b490]
MAPHTPQERVRAAVEPAVAGVGLLLEDVVVTRAGRRSVVRVVVDLPDGPGGVDSDRLADVSRAVSSAMDVADPVAGPYLLEVSTPGTDRPLTEGRHFRRAVGHLVRLTLVDGATRHGRLVAAGSELTLEAADGSTASVPADQVVRGVVEVELSRSADEEGDV